MRRPVSTWRRAKADGGIMYTIYVLKSIRERKFYVGKTIDLERRLNEHNTGKTYYTRRYAPWEIVYTENVISEDEAVAREKYFKSHAGREWLKKKVGL